MSRATGIFLLLVGAGALLGYLGLRVARPGSNRGYRTSLSVSEVMGGGAEAGFDRAMEPRPFAFPRDHGPHPGFRTEWWYLTGNLEGPGGRRLGFQFTVFRSTLDPAPPGIASPWSTNQTFMGHLAVTDAGTRSFRAYERFSRGALGLAGAEAEPFRVWLEDWEIAGPEPEPDAGRGAEGTDGDGIFPLTLRAEEGDRGVSLVLRSAKPLVLQGDRGLSRKGPEPGNASYYYSFTRLEAEGMVRVGGEELPVRGWAWLDREWSTSALSVGQVGWDWFALQLEDGRDLMVYELRGDDGLPDALSRGVLVSREGLTTELLPADLELSVLDRWESPDDGTSYPSGWRLVVPSQALELEIRPLLPNQELDLTFRYWEGAVVVRGSGRGGPVEGRGYVELTGYADPAGRGGAGGS